MSVLTSNPNIGNIRETFFYNQMRENKTLLPPGFPTLPLVIIPLRLAEGRKVKADRGCKNGRIVKDDIETGHGIIIPLWYFGMNY